MADLKRQELYWVKWHGSFQPNSNRGVHPMSWIFFFLSILVDIIETKKFCKFEISTLFHFRVVAIQNMGGSVQKVSREMKDPLKGTISLKLNPLNNENHYSKLFLALDSKYDTFKRIGYSSKKLWGSQNGTNCIWTILWGVTTWKVQIFLLSKILELVASIKFSLCE